MIKPTLELIRDPEALEAAVSKGDADFAAECSLLKWSPENREWLFADVRRIDKPSGLCWHRYKSYHTCHECPLQRSATFCFYQEDFIEAIRQANKDFKKFNKAAEAFYDWMKGILNGDRIESRE
jgi:hypothetical protein